MGDNYTMNDELQTPMAWGFNDTCSLADREAHDGYYQSNFQRKCRVRCHDDQANWSIGRRSAINGKKNLSSPECVHIRRKDKIIDAFHQKAYSSLIFFEQQKSEISA